MTLRNITLTALFSLMIACPTFGASFSVQVDGPEITILSEDLTQGVSYDTAYLELQGPDGLSVRNAELSVRLGDSILPDAVLPDGHYTFQVRLTPMLTDSERETLSRIKIDRATVLHLAKRIDVAHGAFQVVDGRIVARGAEASAGESWQNAVDRLAGERGGNDQVAEMSARVETLEAFLADLAR